MLISEIDSLFKDVFNQEKGMVKTVDTVYETPDEGDYLKLIISIHDLTVEDSIILHTKFIFKVDKKKVNVIENYFNYLYDINCIYHQVNFKNPNDLKGKLIKIIESNRFGKDIQILSEFKDRPGFLLSGYFKENNITKYSIGNVTYDPKFKTKPCNETTFDFVIDVNNYKISVVIAKTDKTKETPVSYKFTFKLLDNIQDIKVEKLINIHFIIGGKIVEMLDNFLK